MLLIFNDVGRIFLKEFVLDAFFLLAEEIASEILVSLFDALLADVFDDVWLYYSPLFHVFGVLNLFVFMLFALLFAVFT